jgi:hypothetical protein
MFKNSDSDSDIEVGHTRSGRVFREVHLVNMFKHNYGDKGFYSVEEVDLIDEDHSEPARADEEEAEELGRDEPETSGTTQTIEVSSIIPPIDSVVLSNQSNPRH